MEFELVTSTRRSVRSYDGRKVEEDKLQKVLAAAIIAPTACDLQPFKLLVIETAGREDELRQIYKPSWFVAAPLVILICALRDQAWSRRDGKNYADVDAAIAMDHLILAANDQGLGTCWVADFDPVAAREVLRLERGWEPLAFTPLGYAKETPAARPRKSATELVIRR